MNSLVRYLGWRTTQSIGVVIAIACINFLILHIAPGDAVDIMAGEAGAGDPEYMEALRKSFGLDQPVHIQLFHYLWNLFQFNLGYSFHYGIPVSELIFDKLPATLLLMVASLLIALLGGIVLGVTASRRPGSIYDTTISLVSLLGYATPLFWLGLMLIVVFSLKLGLLPSNGMYTIGKNYSVWGAALDVLHHLILPAVTLALFFMATYTRIMRAQMLQVFGQEFVRTARSKGISERRVVYRHVLRNAVLPLVSLFGVQVGGVLGGAVVVEVVFGWPGLGRLAFDSIFQRDFNLLMGILFFSSVLVVIVNLLVDFLYALLDPRIEVVA
ncbi:ABC transporter permease [Oceanibacterium hippocampi]|uniref:Dipeptide transport system permease protein DppB n=1 Tax=Oceanibacterium hippocampi TaxID=745714 RepID=A0A1Y5RSM9_9PROT|nr:ABC transporter permease [Oceanibacterium hippocampi]SLN24160.1 Dipeptide transport system permease protein DppB [Oceanibacterium hippocampi]